MSINEEKKEKQTFFLILLFLLCSLKRAFATAQTTQAIQRNTTHFGSYESQLTYNDVFQTVTPPSIHIGLDNSSMTLNDYASATTNVVGHLGTEDIKINSYDKILTAMDNPSGFDPFDPEWSPPCGWTVVYDFSSPDQVNVAFNDIHGNVVVDNGIVSQDIPDQEEGNMSRFIENISWTRIAIAVKLRVDKTNYGVAGVFGLYSAPIPDHFATVITDFPKGTNIHNIHLLIGSEYYSFTLPDDWFLVVLDNTPGRNPYVKIYDTNKNIIFQVEVEPWHASGIAEDIDLHTSNNGFLGTFSFQLDWFALYYGCPKVNKIHRGIDVSALKYAETATARQ
jgi:hypothetical protein